MRGTRSAGRGQRLPPATTVEGLRPIAPDDPAGARSELHDKGRTNMASSGKKKTTMAKLTRESKLRERRMDKQARKDARRQLIAQGSTPTAPRSGTRRVTTRRAGRHRALAPSRRTGRRGGLIRPRRWSLPRLADSGKARRRFRPARRPAARSAAGPAILPPRRDQRGPWRPRGSCVDRLSDSSVVGDPHHCRREVAARGEQRGPLDDVAPRGMRACEALYEGLYLRVFTALLAAHENSVTE